MSFNKWLDTTLGEIYEFSSGLSKNAKEFGFGYSFLSFKTVFYNYFIPDEIIDLANTNEKEQRICSVRKGDAFLTRTSESLNELAMSCIALKDYPKATFNGFTKRLRPKTLSIIDPKYAGYYFRSTKFRNSVTSMASMTTRASLNNEILSRLPITIPPMKEQIEIGNILYSLDKKIELNNRIIKTLEEMAQTIFKSWFVDFERSQNENSDSLPSGWKFYVLGDVSKMSAGGDKPKIFSKIPTETCKIPVYSNGIVNYGLYGYADTARIMTESVTVSARGTIGFICLREEPYVPIVRLVSIVPNAKFLSSKYLYLWLKNSNISGTGTSQQQLTVPDFKKTSILIPANDVMEHFTSIVTPLFAQIAANRIESERLAELRDTLLPKLMSGEIDVSNIST